jgi:pantoate--beta-alanine ligase
MNPNLSGTIRFQFEIVRDFVCGKTPARRLVHEVGAHMAALMGSPSFNEFFFEFHPELKPRSACSKTSNQDAITPLIARTTRTLQRSLDDYRDRKATIAPVPTMGALHDGHMSLVRLAKRRARRVIVSIFVNPTQFAPTEDYGAYPRTWKADVARLAAEAVDIVWNPDVKTSTRMASQRGLFRKVRQPRIGRPLPAAFLRWCCDHRRQAVRAMPPRCRGLRREGLSAVACGGANGTRPQPRRPGHRFVGRARARWGSRCRPAPSISRRNSGVSRRNLFHAIKHAVVRLRAGDDIEAALAGGIEAIRRVGFGLDYLEVRDADTLAPVRFVGDGKLRILVAARLGDTRLIDNMAV